MQASDYEKISNLLKALSHPTRIMIIKELLGGKKCVGDIKDLLKARQPNISQHLSLLKFNNVVGCRQDGRRKCYFLKSPRFLRRLFRIIEESKEEI